jgi:hypothetical protein
LSSSSTTEKKIFTFKLGSNLQSIGISKWIYDANSNEFIFILNDNSGGRCNQIKVPYDKAGVSDILRSMIHAISTAFNKSTANPEMLCILKELKAGYQEAAYNGLGKLISPTAAKSESASTDSFLQGKGKGRRKKKTKQDDALSPSEIEDLKVKEAYRKDVIALREQFENANLTYDQWCALVAEKYFNLKETVESNIKNAWEIMEFCLSIRCVLNIKDNTLPFMGVVLAVPSSNKTLILELFRKTIFSIYLDQFTLHSLISNSSTKTEEELQRSDVLPKMKNKQLITPELAPIFTSNEDELRAILG